MNCFVLDIGLYSDNCRSAAVVGHKGNIAYDTKPEPREIVELTMNVTPDQLGRGHWGEG